MKSFYVEYMCFIMRLVYANRTLFIVTGVWKRLTILHLFQFVFAYIYHTLDGWVKAIMFQMPRMDDDASGKIQILVTVSFLHPVSFRS